MPTFTFIVDYAGGTYISQQAGKNASAALMKWKDRIAVGELAGGVSVDVATALTDVEPGDVVSVHGLMGVCCLTAEGPLGLILINIVTTKA